MKQPSELARLRVRLAAAEEALRAIRSGEVDAVVLPGKKGPQVFTLKGVEHAYRVLIESMNEGALTLNSKAEILYANECFADILKCPLERVLGSSFLDRLPAIDQTAMRRLLSGKARKGSKIHAHLIASDRSKTPVQISIFKLPKYSAGLATIGVVVSDMTEARRNVEMLRALTHRLVQAQEAERGRVAFELHDGITQMLCAIIFRSQALVGILTPWNGPAKAAAKKLNEVAAMAVEEVERISRNLRPGLLEDLGLIAALRDAGAEFSDRTGVIVKLICAPLVARLPLDIELALYRIFQEGLRNVEKHSRARQVKVRLTIKGDFIRMLIKDNGIGFVSGLNPATRKGKGGLGLLSMRERAVHLGGTLKLNSMVRVGTEIEVCIPIASGNDTEN